MIKKAYALEKFSLKVNPIETEGFILDIGGGGQGIIGKLNGSNVISIDLSFLTRPENDSLKILMDATDLKFLTSSFDVATSFFTFLYIENHLHPKVVSEVHRVLKDQG